jgi:hypothetical protein
MCWESAAATPVFHAGFRRRTRPGKVVRAREALERQALTAQAKGDLSRRRCLALIERRSKIEVSG